MTQNHNGSLPHQGGGAIPFWKLGFQITLGFGFRLGSPLEISNRAFTIDYQIDRSRVDFSWKRFAWFLKKRYK